MISAIEPCTDKVKVNCVDIKAGMNSFQWNMQKLAPAGRGAAADTAAQGRFGGRGGQNNGRVAFVAGGRGGGGGGFGGGNAGGGPVEPGSYFVRLTVGDKTFTSSVQVLEDIWMRPQ